LLTTKENYDYSNGYIHKLKIKYYIINQEYFNFRKYFNLYDFHLKYKKELLMFAIKHMSTIWDKSLTCGYFDLSIVFELLYNRINLPFEEIKKINNIFGNYFYNELQNSITNNRETTIRNINNNRKLISLHTEFNGYDKKTGKRKIYSIH
jgi:hypothetical protein